MDKKRCTGIIILNYNNWEDTLNCILSVEKYNTSNSKYIIVDNGSTRNGTVEAIDKFLFSLFGFDYCKVPEDGNIGVLKKATFVVSSINSGYAQGNNKGLKFAYEDSEINEILILNNDILFVQDIVPQLREYLYSEKNCGIVSPLLYTKEMKAIGYNCARYELDPWELIFAYLFMYKNFLGILKRFDVKQHFLKNNIGLLSQKLIKIDLPSGSCMLIKKKVMKEINSFDPNTFLFYEENILYRKLLTLNLTNYIVPSCKCIHLGACSTSKTSNYFSLSCQFKSSIYYVNNYIKLSHLQKILFFVGTKLFWIKLWLIKKLK